MNSTKTTPRAFVCGWPIKHSRSPRLHKYWLDESSIMGSYERIAINPEELPGLFEKIREGKFIGGNITLPHKELALQLVDHADDAANTIGAVNTVYYNRKQLYGTNTDWSGFLANIDAAQPNWSSADNINKSAIVIGAGGASRAILYALVQKKIGKIFLINRTAKKAIDLAEEFSSNDTLITALTFDQLADFEQNIDLIVNTSSLGMNGQAPMNENILALIPKLPSGCIVNDIVYDPMETQILKLAKQNGLTTIDGLGMLLHQAVEGFEKWFGTRPKVSTALREHVLMDLENNL